MFRELYKDAKFIGAHVSPPNHVTIVMEDGVEYHTLEHVQFNSEASIDKHAKELKGTEREKDNIRELFIEPAVKIRGRFKTTMYEF
jgi:hypothetical protein